MTQLADPPPAPRLAPAPAPAGPVAAADARRWWTLAFLCLALVVVVLDNTIVNVALPSLVRELDTSTSELQWVVDAYTLVFAGLLLTAGSVGDRWGRRNALAVGLAIFATGSAASALVTSAPQLIAMRAITGAGAALVFPATLSILTNVFTDPKERQKAIAVWASTAGIGIALGPVTGGFLLEHFYWGSIFWVNLPIVAVGLVGCRFFIPDSRDPRHRRLDVGGALLSILAISALVYGVIEAPGDGWTSGIVLGAFAVSALAAALFVVVELRRTDPLLDLRIFRNRRFTTGSLAIATVYFCLFGTIFLMTQLLQFLLGYTPLEAGLRVVPFAVILMVVANLTPRLVARVGARALLASGLGAAAVSMLIAANFPVDVTYPLVLLSMSVMALGMGLIIAPATALIMGAVPPERAGVGSAINDTTRQIGGTLGVAVMGSIAASTADATYDAAVRGGHLPHGALVAGRDSIGAALQAAHTLPAAAAVRLGDAASHAFVDGLNRASWVAAGLAIAGALAVVRLLPASGAVVMVAGVRTLTVAPVHEFDRDTAVEPTVDGWRADLTDRWSIAGNPNGGYLLATALRAMTAAAGRPDPLTVTAHYLSAATPGPAAIGVDVVRAGRTYSTVTGTLHQDGRERFRVTAALGNLDRLEGPSRLDRAAAPDLPPVDECPDLLTRRAPSGGAAPEIFHRFELRVDPRVGWLQGERGGTNEIAGWIRFADGRPTDVASLPLFADALPPAVLDEIPALWVPTVSLTVMVRARPAPGWLRAVFRTRTIVGGTLEEDGELWDEDGRLVCLSRQLAVVLPTDEGSAQKSV